MLGFRVRISMKVKVSVQACIDINYSFQVRFGVMAWL